MASPLSLTFFRLLITQSITWNSPFFLFIPQPFLAGLSDVPLQSGLLVLYAYLQRYCPGNFCLCFLDQNLSFARFHIFFFSSIHSCLLGQFYQLTSLYKCVGNKFCCYYISENLFCSNMVLTTC